MPRGAGGEGIEVVGERGKACCLGSSRVVVMGWTPQFYQYYADLLICVVASRCNTRRHMCCLVSVGLGQGPNKDSNIKKLHPSFN